ncbi:putative histone h4 protein [Phaeoacremonium minimum UCRPA7]|uniref:Histone H4 n=1 Tax=Phaeoacremonium minimum (strain UCR-PA7) TaxID=1286976 RepID=R8BPX6_PHAM7|nr:putative histone h4 protein [Phaeoacremonium minimum UCRPA7]EOO01438.1 putative histone h4 protein [Phaeoacremonium minimum UCRPA7]
MGFRKVPRDTIRGITKPAIRRLARRGGVKRISGSIYDDIRAALKARLELILKDCVTFTEYRNAKTITIHDVLFALKRIGRPIYGFDPETYNEPRKGHGIPAAAASP